MLTEYSLPPLHTTFVCVNQLLSHWWICVQFIPSHSFNHFSFAASFCRCMKCTSKKKNETWINIFLAICSIAIIYWLLKPIEIDGKSLSSTALKLFLRSRQSFTCENDIFCCYPTSPFFIRCFTIIVSHVNDHIKMNEFTCARNSAASKLRLPCKSLVVEPLIVRYLFQASTRSLLK